MDLFESEYDSDDEFQADLSTRNKLVNNRASLNKAKKYYATNIIFHNSDISRREYLTQSKNLRYFPND